ncbi:MAG: hypothetical protein ACXWM1_13050 [Candidatus Binataceae bacterium]
MSAGSTAARILRVEVLDQLHRTLDVGEQRGDRLALASGMSAPSGITGVIWISGAVGFDGAGALAEAA